MALTVPNNPQKKTIQYEHLLGCDFSQDGSLVDRRHSPYMLNMISDKGGNPVKRKGWEKLKLFAVGEPLGVWSFKISEEYIVTAYSFAGKIYFEQITPEEDLEHISHSIGEIEAENISCAFYYKGVTTAEIQQLGINCDGLWVLVDDKICLITERLTDPYGLTLAVFNRPYTPTIIKSRLPNGSNGGTPYEDINRLSKVQTESFITKITGGDDQSSATVFKLSGKLVNEVGSYTKVERMKSDGTWESVSYTVTDEQTITLNSPAGAPPQDGEDNVRITYTTDREVDTGIMTCRQYAYYALGATDQIFLTASTEKPQHVYYSVVGNPLYFPELNYLDLSGDNGECMGFVHVGSNLAVIKSSKHDNYSNVFLIYDKEINTTEVLLDGSTKASTEYVYAVKRVASSAGAVAINGFGALGDEPLFLSSTGMQGIISLTGTEDRIVRNRSRLVDRKMLAEPNLENAFMLNCNNYMYVFLNNHAYVFDGRHKTGDSSGNTNYMYEAYYWENVPATKACVSGGQIYFIGKTSGVEILCRFKNTGLASDYSDGSTLDADTGRQTGGTAIRAVWTTRNDDDNLPQYLKTMQKKGSMVTIAPYEYTSVDVWAIPDGSEPLNGDTTNKYYIGKFIAGLFTFANIDFSKFLFDGRNGPKDYFFQKKRKKYIRLQLMLENSGMDEPFGIYSLTKTYTATRFAKGL